MIWKLCLPVTQFDSQIVMVEHSHHSHQSGLLSPHHSVNKKKTFSQYCKSERLCTRTHPFNGPFPGLPGSAGTRKVKPIWILLKQETVSGSGISWAICKSASRSRQITMPVPNHSSFLQAGCPSCRPTNSVKALKAKVRKVKT